MKNPQPQKSVDEAQKAWDAAPVHVKVMAGPYMRPVLHALSEMQKAIEEVCNGKHR